MITEYAKMYRCSSRRRNSGTSFLCAWAKVPDFIFLKKYCIIFIESKKSSTFRKMHQRFSILYIDNIWKTFWGKITKEIKPVEQLELRFYTR